jgi:hypothetical protein
MPIPKRWFQVSQDINHDPEVWSLTAEFGDRSLRTWMQILVYLDRSGNEWRVSGDWLGTLARTVRQTVGNVARQIQWMTVKGWLRVRETAAEGFPLVYEAPNWAKYNKRREPQWIESTPGIGTNDVPPLTNPTPSLSNPIHKKEIAVSAVPSPAHPPRRTVQSGDEEFIAQLKVNPAYRHLDIEAELGKMDAWFLTPNGARRKKTRAFVVRWLNQAADRQREVSHVSLPSNSHPACAEKVLASNGRTYVPCGKPIAADQASPPRPFCSDHLPYRQHIHAQLQNGGTA